MNGRAGMLASTAAAAVVAGASAFALLQGSGGYSLGPGSSAANAASRFSDGDPSVRGCRERIEGRSLEPNPMTDTTIGPIAFPGLPDVFHDLVSRPQDWQPYPDVGMPAMKVIALVRSGARVTMIVPRKQRRWMRLLYMLPIAPSGTHRATLEACRQLPTRRAQRRECGWGPRLQGAQWACRSRYTQFSGGFALDFASAPRRGRCAELIVRPEGKGAPRREPLFEPRRHTCGGAARLSHEPAAITNACAQAAARARFAVLCPRRWPPPRGRGAPTTRVFEEAAETYLIDVDNGFSRRGAYVFHALVGGQLRPFGRWPAGVEPALGITTRKVTIPTRGGGTFVQQLPARRIATARVHGFRAAVLREPPYPKGALHGGHVLVLWNARGHGYLVSVHGERLSQRALVTIALAMARSARVSGLRGTRGLALRSAERR